MGKKIEKWQEPAPAKQTKVLPAPDMEPKKRRGGRRFRKMKERYGLTGAVHLPATFLSAQHLLIMTAWIALHPSIQPTKVVGQIPPFGQEDSSQRNLVANRKSVLAV